MIIAFVEYFLFIYRGLTSFVARWVCDFSVHRPLPLPSFVSHTTSEIFQFIRAQVHDVHDVSTFTSTSAVWDWFQCSFVTRFSAFSFSSMSLYFFSILSTRTKTAQCAHSEWALNFISCPFYHLARITFVCWRSSARVFAVPSYSKFSKHRAYK